MDDNNFDLLVSAVAKQLADFAFAEVEVPHVSEVREQVVGSNNRATSTEGADLSTSDASFGNLSDEVVATLASQFAPRSVSGRQDDIPLEKIEI